MQSLGECQQQYNLVVRCLALHSKWIFFLLWGIEQPASALLWIFTSQEDVSVGRQVWLHTCLCVCVGARTHSPDCLCWQQTAVRSEFFRHMCSLCSNSCRGPNLSVLNVCLFFVSPCSPIFGLHRSNKSRLCPPPPPPLLSVQPAPFKHVTVAASPQAGLIIPRPGPARHVCTSGLRAILCVLDTKM